MPDFHELAEWLSLSKLLQDAAKACEIITSAFLTDERGKMMPCGLNSTIKNIHDND